MLQNIGKQLKNRKYWYEIGFKQIISISIQKPFPQETSYKLKKHQTFRKHPVRPLNVLRTFNLSPVYRGLHKQHLPLKNKTF